MVLVKPSIGPWNIYNYFGGRVPPPAQEKKLLVENESPFPPPNRTKQIITSTFQLTLILSYRLAGKYLGYGLDQMLGSIFINRAVKELKKYVPQVNL